MDEIGANVSSLVQTTELIQETVPQPTDMQKKLFIDAVQTARQTSRETRNFINFLESDKKGFDVCEQIQKVAQRMLGTIECRYKFETPSAFFRMSPSAQWDLLMFVKEALNNIIKHADADRVDILVQKQKNRIQLVMTDNGKGIPEEQVPPKHLEARAKQLNAKLDIQTGSDGTRLTLYLK